MAVRSAKPEPATRNVRTRTPRTAREGPTVSVRKQSVSDVIARSLEEDIVHGRRHPREHLVEQHLCERFNTHRGDVRLPPLPVAKSDLDKLAELQRKHSAAIDAGDLLTVFYSNLHFHQMLFGLCCNTCL